MRALLTLALFAASLHAQLPRPAADFAVRMPDGKEIHLSQYKGKVLLLEFILTTCPHCQNTSVLTEKLYQEYRPGGLEVLSAAIDPMASPNDFRQKYGLSFPVGVQTEDKVKDFLQHSTMLRFLLPQVVFIDRKGMIRAHFPGGDPFFEGQEANMRKQIEMYLSEGMPTPAPKKTTAVTKKK